MSTQLLYGDVTEKIIEGYFQVDNTLGYGFLEKVYENSLVIALRTRGLIVQQQWAISVAFEGELVGDYFADLLVNDRVIVEIKSAEAIIPRHEAQLLNYLRATNIRVGLLVNFGPEPRFIRKVV
ncbi:MAG: GxxExxY protein [Aeoliella sp.]